jgi:UDP-N-acetylglucosamine diphosphorylase / glucose-1-phosphate thymidylyltransferase / UDP-N-acetylgalactosamine diphosphorylase / glucosamine-1-phosphate N-acetyltransferase / galactosamine-1-phosphate N-acetyltransferase
MPTMVHPELSVSAYLDLSKSMAAPVFEGLEYPWQAIPLIAAFVEALLADPPEGYELVGERVLAHREAKISPRAELLGPAVIGKGAEIGPGAYIRAFVIVGDSAVAGNSTELKNCILFDGAQAPHFNYVGDSIMGHASHMGAGAVLSNQRSDKGEVVVHAPGGFAMRTGLLKFGAVLGDRAELGCNSVCFPGSLVGRDAVAYPLCPVRGVVPARSIVKADGRIAPRREGRG